ncbi:DUF6302 family protein [Streptomyces sp. NPDC087658]|uniref:DUF6302 family protein n=1 Tax=Streptomyces sp. NPDC087658 TaxID=3365800 RepID=UPI0037FA5889
MYPRSTIKVWPAHDAYDYEYLGAGLADRRLLDDSVAIQVFRAPLLAVPVGGRRRGGYFIVSGLSNARAVCDVLRGRPGFLLPRQRWAPAPDSYYVVEWGERGPRGDADTRARFYGYAEEAIVTGRVQLPPLPPDPFS